MLGRWRARWRPWRSLLRRRLGLGRFGSRGLAARLEATQQDLVATLTRLYPGVSAPPQALAGDARSDGAALAFRQREARVHSQNGEDGLLLHIFSAIGATDRRLVEFGIEDGRECLARTLLVHFGWSGLLLEAEHRSVAEARRFYRNDCRIGPERVRIEHCTVTAENINDVLRDHGMTGEIDLLSIDIDGNDYWVWKAVDAIRPRVVAIEYNASFGPDETLTVQYDPAFERKTAHPSGWYHGASLAALEALAARKGYALVGCDSSGINAFFVLRELAGGALRPVPAAEAWRPHRRRAVRASHAEQFALVSSLPLHRGL